MEIKERIDLYNKRFPKWPPPYDANGRIEGVWVIGNNYQGSGYYGAYPPNYLERVGCMFTEKENILHLFSGSLPPGDYIRFDSRVDVTPDIIGDAHELSKYVNKKFDIIYADPPYSQEDAEHYGTILIKRNKVLNECYKVLEDDGHLVWLDEVFPMFTKRQFHLYGLFPIIRSTNHRVRCCFIFQKVKDK